MSKHRTILLIMLALCMSVIFACELTEKQPSPELIPEPNSELAPDDEIKVLVAYFSNTGNTASLAEYTADILNADLYEIAAEVPYIKEDLNYNADVQVNTVHPGWVPTRMGAESGSAPDSLREGYMTQVWLAEGIEKDSQVSGEFFFHKQPELNFQPIIHDVSQQEALIGALEEITGIYFPEN